MSSAEPLAIDNCPVLRPSMEDIEDELKFLSSDLVQEAGKRCGIVRVRFPDDFCPTRDHYSTDDISDEVWVNNLPVLDQRFLSLDSGPWKEHPGMYLVARRTEEPYMHKATDWKLAAEKWQKITEAHATRELRKRNPAFKALSSDPRQRYWETRPYQSLAFYGADIPQSAMKKDQKNWNFDSPDFPCLTRIFDTDRTPGVYTPYLYVGSWGSTFALHPEDKDLYSLNYLHEGASKFWYGMSSSLSSDVEKFARELLPDEPDTCEQFLRHKTLLVEPQHFLNRGIQVYAAEQKEGDLMITFPNAYHYGFNSGFNVAEARNIATVDWLDWGLKAKQCNCHPDVLPYERIVQMALKADPVKYAHLRTTKAVVSNYVYEEEEEIPMPTKRQRSG